jgi:hypothetical protein
MDCRRVRNSSRFEGFGQVVVSASVEPAHPVFHAIACGQYQHRQRRQALTQGAQHGQAVDVGQAEVQHHAIVQRLFAIGSDVDVVPRLHQLGAQPIA